MAGRRRTGLTSGINLLTQMLIQSNEDELSRRRKAEELSARIELDYQGKRNEAFLSRGLDRIGKPDPELTQVGRIIPEGQILDKTIVDEEGNVKTFYRSPTLDDLRLMRKGVNPSTGKPYEKTLDSPTSPVSPKSQIGTMPEVPTAETQSAIRSMGQRILTDALRMQTGGFLQPRRETSAIPQIATRTQPLPAATPKTIQSRQGISDFRTEVESAKDKLDQGADPEALINHYISKGVDPQVAQEIVEDANH